MSDVRWAEGEARLLCAIGLFVQIYHDSESQPLRPHLAGIGTRVAGACACDTVTFVPRPMHLHSAMAEAAPTLPLKRPAEGEPGEEGDDEKDDDEGDDDDESDDDLMRNMGFLCPITDEV